MGLPLDGVRILDLSRYLPGPFCSQLLADFGAEVIKIEDPRGGELGRHLAPLVNGESTRFYTVNRNKKSITLDLKHDEGKAIFKRLVKNSDVVIDQFRPGFMEEIGLGYEVQKDINDRIIYCAITGYGLSGPLRNAAGHDLNYLSLAGITGLTGAYKGEPGTSSVQIADIAGGALYAVIAILLALASREKTGKGQVCDVSMFDGSITLLAYTLGEWLGVGRLPERGNEVLTGGYACYHIYKTKDGKFMSLGAIETKFWTEFCRKINREKYISFQWDEDRQTELIADIENIMLEKTRDEWVEYFTDSNICFTPVLNLDEMCNHPHVIARNMIYSTNDNQGDNKIATGIPIKLSATPGEIKLNFPALGEHTEQVLLQAGYTREEITKFRQDNVI